MSERYVRRIDTGREPCSCTPNIYVEVVHGQHVARCFRCRRYLYCRNSAELGTRRTVGKGAA